MASIAQRRCARRSRARLLTSAAVALALASAGGALAHEGDDRLPAALTMDFVPPPPGSYPLPAIMRAPDGPVLDRDGRRLPLSRFTAGRITLLGFIYASCADPRGCPLTAQVFRSVRHRVADDPELRPRVRLVSLSFDPVRDTPAAMRRYAADVSPHGVEWAFLTTGGPRALAPLLDGFGQDVRVELDARGRPAGPLAHVLKVFLLDRRGVVREIYTTSYLYPEVIVNDIKTLRLEEQAPRRVGP
jgi:cytochrome oxidase Cu insertion factor (SCO1/SenC/PrrC family)